MRPAPATAAERESRARQAEERWRLQRELGAVDAARLERLRALGRPARIALIGCGKAKRQGVHRARNLYVGKLFRSALAYADKFADEIYILSAFYGFVSAEQEIASYERSLASMGKTERASWSARARAQIVARFAGVDAVFIGLAGKDYLDACTGLPVERPLAGMGIGQRLSFFKVATEVQA